MNWLYWAVGLSKKNTNKIKWQSIKLPAVYLLLSARINDKILNHYILFIHRLRCMIHWIVTKKIFDLFIMFVIVLSSIALAAEDPVSENSERNKVLGFADYWFTAIFTLEVLLKVLIKRRVFKCLTENSRDSRWEQIY